MKKEERNEGKSVGLFNIQVCLLQSKNLNVQVPNNNEKENYNKKGKLEFSF